jgi:hypothetical protein
MSNEVLLIAAIGVPAVGLFLLRVNGALAFLSLCAGSVFLTLAGSDTDLIASSISKSTMTEPAVKLGLVLLPFILCLLLLRKSISSAKSLLNIVPSVFASVLALLLIKPLLPGSLQASLAGSQSWTMLDQAQELVAAGGIVISFLFLFVTKPHEHSLGKRRKH